MRVVASKERPETMEIRVSDTGVGIDRTHLRTLFDAFSQGDESTTRRFGGTGLGLAISRRLAEGMGGDIRVESEVGRGSTFTAILPAEPVEATHEADVGAVPCLSSPGVELRPGRVLVADDNAVNRKLACRMLERLGFEAVSVDDGLQAVDAFADGRWDLLLLDVHMPELDGLGAVARIRALEAARRLPRTPVVALTASAREADRRRCLEAGMDDFLSKPLRQAVLEEVLAKWTADAPDRSSVTSADSAPASGRVPGRSSSEPSVTGDAVAAGSYPTI